MESNAPRVAVGGRVSGGLLLIISIMSWKLIPEDVLSTENRNLMIYSLIAISIISFIISFWASRERKIPELNENPSVEQQFADLESSPTVVRSVSTSTDQFGLETVNSQTKGIIESVIGIQYEPSTGEISAAIDSLSKGDIGASSAAEASSNPAPHKHATQVLETVSIGQNDSPGQRSLIDNIPLPNMSVAPTPDLSWMEEDATFISEVAVKEIPLPAAEKEDESAGISLDELGSLEPPSQIEYTDTPDLPDFDSVEIDEVNVAQKTPELPNLDNLF